MYNDKILEAVNSFQRCQRNFDLDKTVDPEIVELLYTVALTTPSKQNLVNFDVIAVTNREMVREVALAAVSENVSFEDKRRLQNPQVDCNLLFIYVEKDNNKTPLKRLRDRGPLLTGASYHNLVQCEVGISAGAVGLAAHLLGLRTGFSRCFTEELFPDSVFRSNRIDPLETILLLGIGYPKYENHTLHTDGYNYSASFPKQKQRKIVLV